MDYHQLLEDIKNREKDTAEFKKSFGDINSIGRSIAGFSTEKGGKIYIGVDDMGCPIGTTCKKNIKDRLITLARTINPIATISVDLVKHDSEKDYYIVIVNVEKGRAVYSYKGVPYQRRGAVNHPLTTDEVFELQKNIKKIYFDEFPATCEERPAIILDIDEMKVKEFLSSVKNIKEEKFDLKRFTHSHNLFINGDMKIKNVAIMIFGKNVRKFIPQSKISICEFPSEKITDDFIKTEIEGDLITILKRTMFDIKKRMNIHSFIRGFQRIDIPEYPEEALKEAITNAVIHRDYFDDNTEISIKIFKDRIEILNPAKFPFHDWTWKEIEKTGSSVRRNPRCAEFFESMNLMEKEGTGLGRIKQKISEHGLPNPKIEVGEKTFKITFYNQRKQPKKLLNSPYKILRDATDLNERQTKFLENIQKYKVKSINRSEYMKLFNIHEKTASRDLNDLVQRGLFQKSGIKRGTRYTLI
jgi:ATP-dependent DNA helicase RecG